MEMNKKFEVYLNRLIELEKKLARFHYYHRSTRHYEAKRNKVKRKILDILEHTILTKFPYLSEHVSNIKLKFSVYLDMIIVEGRFNKTCSICLSSGTQSLIGDLFNYFFIQKAGISISCKREKHFFFNEYAYVYYFHFNNDSVDNGQ